jgi:hypothetical protein
LHRSDELLLLGCDAKRQDRRAVGIGDLTEGHDHDGSIGVVDDAPGGRSHRVVGEAATMAMLPVEAV